MWLAGDTAIGAYFIWYATVRLDFDPSCAITHVNTLVIGFGYICFDILANVRKLTFCSSLIGVTIQAAVLVVLFRRRKVVAPGPLKDVPVAYIVLRDGFLSFLGICGHFRSYLTKQALTF